MTNAANTVTTPCATCGAPVATPALLAGAVRVRCRECAGPVPEPEPAQSAVERLLAAARYGGRPGETAGPAVPMDALAQAERDLRGAEEAAAATGMPSQPQEPTDEEATTAMETREPRSAAEVTGIPLNRLPDAKRKGEPYWAAPYRRWCVLAAEKQIDLVDLLRRAAEEPDRHAAAKLVHDALGIATCSTSASYLQAVMKHLGIILPEAWGEATKAVQRAKCGKRRNGVRKQAEQEGAVPAQPEPVARVDGGAAGESEAGAHTISVDGGLPADLREGPPFEPDDQPGPPAVVQYEPGLRSESTTDGAFRPLPARAVSGAATLAGGLLALPVLVPVLVGAGVVRAWRAGWRLAREVAGGQGERAPATLASGPAPRG